MRRRQFIAALGAAAAIPLPALAQQASRMPRVGVLMAGSENSEENAPRAAAFRKALSELGWKEGDNVRIDYRWSDGKPELIQQYTTELVALAPDVILANSTPVVSAFKNMTSSVPVVFALSMDPVGLGHVDSLSRPGGNFTGFTFIDPELIGKWVGLLKEVMPRLVRGALLYNPDTVHAYTNFVREAQERRLTGDVELVALPVRTAGELEGALEALARQPDRD